MSSMIGMERSTMVVANKEMTTIQMDTESVRTIEFIGFGGVGGNKDQSVNR